MRFAPLVLALVLALLLPSASGASWSHPGGSPANLFSSADDSELSPANIAQTRQRWQWALPTYGNEADDASAPVVAADGLVFVLVNRRRVDARDAATGVRRWVAQLDLTSRDVPEPRIVAVGRTVYTHSGGRLLSFPTRCRTDGGACAPRIMAQTLGTYDVPVVTSTRVVVTEREPLAPYRNRLLAFSRSCVEACTPAWHSAHRNEAFSAPSAADGLAWVGTRGGSLLGYPLDCAGACEPTRQAVVGESVHGRAPAVTARRLYVLVDGRIMALPATCTPAEPCARTWRSQAADYTSIAVGSTRVWAGRQSTTPRLDAFSTSCTVTAGSCAPALSIDLTAGDPALNLSAGDVSVADGLVFAPMRPDYNSRGGVKVYSASCSTSTCPMLRRFGSMEVRDAASVSGGFVYMVEEVPHSSGSDPYPHRNYVRGYALPD